MFVPFQSANDIGDRFLDLLHRLGINPPIGSAIEDELLSLTQLLEVLKNPALAQGPNEERILRSAAGIYDLAAKVLTVEPLPEFKQFVPHLKLIGKIKVRVASLGQNAFNEHDDDTARKIAELYVGCLAAHLGTQVDLDDPDPKRPRGDNPDVMFTMEDANHEAKRWALAIKTIGEGRSGQTIFERIEDGSGQINAPKCRADRGMVVINAKNAICHKVLWKTSYANLREAFDGLEAELRRVIEEASKNRPQEEWDRIFTGKTMRPIIFMAQTIVNLPTPFGRLPTPLGMIVADGAGGAYDGDGIFIADQMNEYMQNIRFGVPGVPGSPGKLPR
jgi:hypothetical protein